MPADASGEAPDQERSGSGRHRRGAAAAGAAEKIDGWAENEVRRTRHTARRKEECDQCNNKRRRAREGRAMDCTILMLALLPVTGYRRTVRIAETDFEPGRFYADCKL